LRLGLQQGNQDRWLSIWRLDKANSGLRIDDREPQAGKGGDAVGMKTGDKLLSLIFQQKGGNCGISRILVILFCASVLGILHHHWGARLYHGQIRHRLFYRRPAVEHLGVCTGRNGHFF